MAKGKKTGGKDFKPGESGNPNGRPPLPADLKEARALNKQEFERILNRFAFMSIAEVEAEVERPGVSVLEVAVANVLRASASQADEKRLDFIVTRLIGNVPKVHEHSGPDGKPIEFNDHEAAAKLAAILNAARARKGE